MGKLVMIVDDSESLREVTNIALSSAGYEVLEACDGKDALKKLDGKKINLIISDVNMPNMDGITLVKEIKKISAYKFTPIIMMTTVTDGEVKESGRQAGVKAWIVKPFQPTKMLQAVEKLIM